MVQASPSSSSGTDAAHSRKEPEQGVLLYYQYVDLRGIQDEVATFYRERCTALQLTGRVRVAQDGVNATLGGEMSALRQHASEVESARWSCSGSSGPIDFKLAARAPGEARNQQAVAESKFDGLAVRLCKVRRSACTHACTAAHVHAQCHLHAMHIMRLWDW